MTVTRAQALFHLQYEFDALARETKQETSDSDSGFGPALDKALRALGTADADLSAGTVTDAQAPALLALAEYHALQRFWRALAARGDTSGRNVLGPRSIVFQQVKDLLVEASDRCAELGYPVRGGQGFEFGRLNLDYIEAEPIE